MSFASLIGQSNTIKRLGAALHGGPGHAYLFTGPGGIGKKTFSRAFAKSLLCEQPDAHGSCGICASCRHFELGVHADYIRISLEDKEKNIPVERIRKSVCSDLQVRPQFGNRKVYHLDIDNMNEQGQNALLKSLEEPPVYAVFLLTAAGPERLLATVLSRVTVLSLQRYTPSELRSILHQSGCTNEAEQDFYIRYANGLPGSALELAGNPAFRELRDAVVDFYFRFYQTSRTWLLTEGYTFFDEKRDHVRLILDIFASLIRDQLMLVRLEQETRLINKDLLFKLKNSLPDTNACERLARGHDAIVQSGRALALNASYEGLICNLLLSLRKELAHA